MDYKILFYTGDIIQINNNICTGAERATGSTPTTTLRRLPCLKRSQKLIPLHSSFKPLSHCTSTQIHGTPVGMSYLSEFLHRIGTKSRTMYNMFYLCPATQTWIIALGIKRQPRQYRGSRAGRSVFGCIHCRITSLKERSNSNVKWSAVLTTLLTIQPTVERHTHLSVAHVNAWSIGNKIGPFQHYL